MLFGNIGFATTQSVSSIYQIADLDYRTRIGTWAGAPGPYAFITASFTYDAGQSTPVSGTSGSIDLHTQIKGCLLKADGTVNYYLNATDWTKKEDNTTSVLTGADGNVMVEIPKFYVSASMTGTGGTRVVTYFVTADSAALNSGYIVHPAFYRSGSEVDYRYIGAYIASGYSGSGAVVTATGALATGSSNNILRSVSGSAPISSRPMSDHRQLARNIGNNWGLLDYYLLNAVDLLFLSEYKTLDTQTAIGVGAGSNTTIAGGSTAYANRSTPTGYVGNQRYRGIEGLTGVGMQWIDGILMTKDNPILVYSTNNQQYFNDTSIANYIKMSGSISVSGTGFYSGDYIIKVPTGSLNLANGVQIIPSEGGGSSTTKFTDFMYSPISYPNVLYMNYCRGTNNNGTAGGWFYAETNERLRSDAYVIARLAY